MATLNDDYYEFDERRHTLIGRRSRRAFRLGDRVRVRVERVNTDRHLVDFSVVNSATPEPPGTKVSAWGSGRSRLEKLSSPAPICCKNLSLTPANVCYIPLALP